MSGAAAAPRAPATPGRFRRSACARRRLRLARRQISKSFSVVGMFLPRGRNITRDGKTRCVANVGGSRRVLSRFRKERNPRPGTPPHVRCECALVRQSAARSRAFVDQAGPPPKVVLSQAVPAFSETRGRAAQALGNSAPLSDERRTPAPSSRVPRRFLSPAKGLEFSQPGRVTLRLWESALQEIDKAHPGALQSWRIAKWSTMSAWTSR